MRISEKAVLHITTWVTIGLLLIAMLLTSGEPARADAFPEDADEPEVALITPGVNRLVATTTCGELLTVTLAIFEGPEELKGELLVFTWQEGLTHAQNQAFLSQVGASAINQFSPAVFFIALEDTEAWRCA